MINSPLSIQCTQNKTFSQFNKKIQTVPQNFLQNQLSPAIIQPIPVKIVTDSNKNNKVEQITKIIVSFISIAVTIWMFASFKKYMGNITSMTKDAQQNKIFKNIKVPQLSQLALSDNLNTLTQKIKTAILHPEKLIERGAKPENNSILLYGPPGCGKTTFAQSLARELGAKFADIKMSELGSSFIGQSEKNIRKTADAICAFADKNPAERIVVFIDEIDSIAMKDFGSNSMYSNKIVDEFKDVIENCFNKRKNIIIIGATNFDINKTRAIQENGSWLNKALLSRFHHKLEIPLPTEKQLACAIANRYSQNSITASPELKNPNSQSVEEIAKKLHGLNFSFRDLEKFFKDVAYLNLDQPVNKGQIDKIITSYIGDSKSAQHVGFY